jgi:hypothetical protein
MPGMENDALLHTKAMRDLARRYHSLGFNIIPLGEDKRPVKTGVSPNGKPWRFLWDEWQNIRQSTTDLNRILQPAWWQDVYGIAGVCGFNGWVCIDFDSRHKEDASIPPIPHEVALHFLEELGLPAAYPWLVKTPNGGWHIWDRVDAFDNVKGKLDRLIENEPTVSHVELRWYGHYVALPGSHHQRGNYEFSL